MRETERQPTNMAGENRDTYKLQSNVSVMTPPNGERNWKNPEGESGFVMHRLDIKMNKLDQGSRRRRTLLTPLGELAADFPIGVGCLPSYQEIIVHHRLSVLMPFYALPELWPINL